MSKKVTPLTDTLIKSLKPADKFRCDGNGLFIIINKDGRKWWRFDYIRPTGGRNSISFGYYPTVTLQRARQNREEARAGLKQGIDPSLERKEKKAKKRAVIETEQIEAAGQIHLVAYRWLDTIKSKYTETTHKKRVRAFERDIFPYFTEYDENRNIKSSKHIREITHADLLEVIRIKERTAAETAHRLLTDCNRLWLYAISENHADFNIVTNISKKDALQKHTKQHYPKITDEKILSELLQAIDNYHGQTMTRQAMRLICYLPLRAENLCALKWSYVDFENAVIKIPRSEMKTKNKNFADFKLPIPPQAIEILKEIHKSTKWGVWVFHGITDFKKHLGLETINKALRSMGFTDEAAGRKQTTHSFRGTFRSLTDTKAHLHKAPFEVREAVLDHHESKGQVRAYTHKADYTEQMKPLLEWWANFIDTIRKSNQH
jgi:integrase